VEYTCLYIAEFAAWALSRRWRKGSNFSRPLVVCWAGRVFSFTPGLERRGLAIGDPVDRARSLTPEAEFHLRDVEVERAIWDSLLAYLYEFSPQVEPLPAPQATRGARRSSPVGRGKGPVHGLSPRGVDPRPIAAADGTRHTGIWDNGVWALLHQPEDLPLHQLCRQVGARLGVAPGRHLAMLAAAHSEPGRRTTVPGQMVAPFLRQAPVDLLTAVGFSDDMVQRLHLFGLRAIGHILSLSRRQLVAQFGPEGGRLHAFLHPPQPDPPVCHYTPRTLAAGHDFEWPVFEPGQLLPILHQLLGQLVQRLCGRAALHLQVRLLGRDRHRVREAGRLLKEPVSVLGTLQQAADGLLTQALQQPTTPRGGVPGGHSVERLVVVLSGLTELPPQQTSLFRSKATLSALAKRMEGRFPGKLVRPVQTHADPFFPEEEYRLEPVCP